jgi:hypothetical protein
MIRWIHIFQDDLRLEKDLKNKPTNIILEIKDKE